jgi:hypothetical protein
LESSNCLLEYSSSVLEWSNFLLESSNSGLEHSNWLVTCAFGAAGGLPGVRAVA